MHAKIAERRADSSVREAVKELEKLAFKRYLLSSFHKNLDRLRITEKDELGKMRDIPCQVSTRYYKRLRSTSKAFLKKEEFRRFLQEAPIETPAKLVRRLAILAEKKTYLFFRNHMLEDEGRWGSSSRRLVFENRLYS